MTTLTAKGVGLRILDPGIDAATPTGERMLTRLGPMEGTSTCAELNALLSERKG